MAKKKSTAAREVRRTQINPFCSVNADGHPDPLNTIWHVQAGLKFLRESAPDPDFEPNGDAELGRVLFLDVLHEALGFAQDAIISRRQKAAPESTEVAHG